MDWLSGLAIFISVIAIYVSYTAKSVSNSILLDDFVLKHRPYIWAVNHSYIKGEEVIKEPNVIRVLVTNSPAILTKESYLVYYMEGNRKIEINHFVYSKNRYMLPNTPTEFLVSFPGLSDYNIFKNLPNTKKIIREVEINYKGLNSRRTFTYKSKSEFIKGNYLFSIISEEAS